MPWTPAQKRLDRFAKKIRRQLDGEWVLFHVDGRAASWRRLLNPRATLAVDFAPLSWIINSAVPDEVSLVHQFVTLKAWATFLGGVA